MRSPILISFTLITLPLTTHAITNIESQNNHKPEQGAHGSLEVSISGKSGNSDKQTHSLGGRFSYRSGSHQLLTLAKAEYGKSNDTKDTDNNFFHQRYLHHYSDDVALEYFLQYQDDTFKLLESRALVGAGTRFKFDSRDNNYYLSIGVGAYYTEEIYDITDTIQLQEDYARANTYINYSSQLTDSTSVSNTLYWQPRFSQPSDSYIYNNLSASVKINKVLTLKVTLETQYDSMPVNDLEHTDNSYFTSLEYNF